MYVDLSKLLEEPFWSEPVVHFQEKSTMKYKFATTPFKW
jgi:hypothetical protein